MAEISPFRALRYNPQLVPALDSVVTQPYDKITPEMQARYYQLSPYNLVRIIRGVPQWEGEGEENIYTRAAWHFHRWIEQRILVSESEPALYPYYQEYLVPGNRGERKVRRGFIGLGRLEDYSAGIIHRHEETLTAPKADRLELLQRTRADFGQIFMLYSDTGGQVEAAWRPWVREQPWEEVIDEYGSRHTVWRVTDPVTIQQVVTAMRSRKLIIADGHHRYETALAYRDQQRAQNPRDERAEYAMMTFVPMEGDLTILPTHRVVRGLREFSWHGFAAKAQRVFDWEDISADENQELWLAHFLQLLARAGQQGCAIGVHGGPGKLALLGLTDEARLARWLPELPESLRRLDVAILHRVILEQLLGIGAQAVREEENLRYLRDSAAAIQEVNGGRAQLCFLLNPTPIEVVRETAFAGLPLPQKSTDFFPKLLSGLTIYWLDNPLGM